MRTVILVAVRLHSTRLPGKALIKVGGKTILEHLIDRIRLAKEPDEQVICTSVHDDDRKIIELADRIGVKWFAGSEDDVLDRFIKAAEREEAKTVIRVTGDNPLTDPMVMDLMIKYHRQNKAEYTFTEDLPRGTRCEVLELETMKRAHELAEDPSQTEYMSLYFRQPKFFKVLQFIVPDDVLKKPNYRFTIDTPEDLEVFETVYDALYDQKEKGFPNLREIIEFIDLNPAIAVINQNYLPKWETLSINSKLRKRKLVAGLEK